MIICLAELAPELILDFKVRGGIVMQCYVCAQSKVETEAIAVCIVCGMAVCQDHLVRADIDMWEGGYPIPPAKLKKKLPRILCKECYDALITQKA
jgi:hypothetical protein